MLNPDTTMKKAYAAVQAMYNDIYIILAPPRCSSTAFARVFWEQPSINFYCHEPFDTTYHKKSGVDSALEAIERAIDIRPFKRSFSTHERKLLIKEMTFQIGKNLPVLLSITRRPVIFLIRHPFTSIWSRMQKLQEGGQNPFFPSVESGWDDLQSQILYCQNTSFPYIIIDSADFRKFPELICRKVFALLGLPFSALMLSWPPVKDVSLGNLGETQVHWYRHVLLSTGVEPDEEAFLSSNQLSNFGKMEDHVQHCLSIYEKTCQDMQRIRI